MLVEQTGDYGADGRFATLTSRRFGFFSTFLHYLGEPGKLLDVDYVEEIGAGIFKVWAEMVLDFLAHGSHGFVEDGLNERHAAAAARAGLGARFDVADGFASALFDTFHDVALGNVMA